jgi:hypothetical protein
MLKVGFVGKSLLLLNVYLETAGSLPILFQVWFLQTLLIEWGFVLSFLKRTPTGKWVCPKCRNQPLAHKSSVSLNPNSQQQKGMKGGEDHHSQKISSKEKHRLPSVLSEKSAKRLREEVDTKLQLKKRVRSKVDDSVKGGHQLPKCADCGAAISSSRSGLCHVCQDERGEARDCPSARPSQEEKQLGTCNTCGEHENLVDCTGCSGVFCKNCLFQASGVCAKPGFICAFGWCQWLVGLI